MSKSEAGKLAQRRYLKTVKGRVNKRKCERLNRQGTGHFAYVRRHVLYKGLTWLLTQPQYQQIIAQPCYYCTLQNDVKAGVGLDRLDNTRGYELDNVVSCCKLCNYIRGDRLTSKEMQRLGPIIRQIKLDRVQ